MKVTLENIGPKKAQEWLKTNIANRPLSLRRIENYAKAMSDGVWQLNGDTIRFNTNGNLIDGQHRLSACVKSGKPFQSYVARGLEHEAFDTIDQGKSRSISDVLARVGCKNYHVLSSALRWIYRYKGGEDGIVSRGAIALRPDQAHAILNANPDLHEQVEFAIGLCRQQPGLIAGSILAFLLHSTDAHENGAREFWSSVVTGVGLQKGSPAHSLNRRLVANMGSAAKLSPISVCALCIKAWNFYATKKPCICLKWQEFEEFPRFTTKNK